MSLKTDKLLTTFVEAINKTKDGTKPYDTTAEVTRVEDDTVWVHIPSGVSETPIRKTIACSVGDTVQIRVSGGTAWITGNSTAPPTDDARANVAYNVAVQADENALLATEYANSAEQEAKRAKESADGAVSSARLANEKAQEAKDSADEAKGYAEDAQESAEDAVSYANSALTQLGIVEDVVGTLNWISEHGTYKASTDTEVVEGKYYFTRTGSGTPSNPYVYTVVPNPTGNPSANHYYELDSVDEAVSNYVSSHLALTSQGLWVINDNSAYKILLSNTGMKVYNASGTEIASFGASITFNANSTQYIGNNNCFVAFNPANGGSLTIGGATINIGNQTLDQVLADKADSDDIPTKTSDLTNDSNFANTTQVDTAKNEAISTASTDATNKANDAKKIATNFLAVDSSGIMVYDGVDGTQTPTAPSASTRNVFIDSDSVDIRQGTNVLATFGENTQIGENETAHMSIATTRLSGSGSSGMEYFSIDANGSELETVYKTSLTYTAPSQQYTARMVLSYTSFYDMVDTGQQFIARVTYYYSQSAQSISRTFIKGTQNVSDTELSYYVNDNGRDYIAVTGYGTPPSGQTYVRSNIEAKITKNAKTPTYEFGGDLTSSGGYAFAEGYSNTASGDYSHAEGKETVSSGVVSHAEGQSNTSSGNYSHAEGYHTTSSGQYSHSQGFFTIANGSCQTVIGKLNAEDSNGTYSFIIGNGTSSANRLNVFTVDWNGNVDIKSGAKYKINGVDLSATDVGALPSSTAIPTKVSDLQNDSGFITTETDPTVPSWAKASTKPTYTASEVGALSANDVADYIVEQGTSGIWTYRKWNSGIAECWGYTSTASIACTSQLSGSSVYYSAEQIIAFPSGLFNDVPKNVQVSVWDGGYGTYGNISSWNKNNFLFYYYSPKSQTRNMDANISAKGRWK